MKGKKMGLPGSEDGHVEAIRDAYIQHMMSERFVRRSQSNADNQNKEIHGSLRTSTDPFFFFHRK
jgi:hypothetical protein